MAESMSMNKIIHAALRRDLARFDTGLASFPAGDSACAAQLGTAWRFFYQELDYHHHGEHDIAWPALREVGASQELLDQMDAEHERLATALTTTSAAFAALVKDATAANAQAARDAIGQLTQVAEEHLQHEERELEPVYQNNRETKAIKDMGRKFARRNVFQAGDFFAWLTNGASDQELAALRGDVPPPVVAIFRLVFGRRYRRMVAPAWK